jgi:hypothetical protein
MQGKSKSLAEKISRVWPRRSDVRKLAGILKTGEAALTVESDSHIFETVEELLSSTEPIRVIELRRKEPYVYVKIETDSIFVWHRVSGTSCRTSCHSLGS